MKQRDDRQELGRPSHSKILSLVYFSEETSVEEGLIKRLFGTDVLINIRLVPSFTT